MKKTIPLLSLLILSGSAAVPALHAAPAPPDGPAAPILPPTLTPPPPDTPRINGPGIFGVRPGSPFLYTIPATGRLPIAYSADGLPAGLSVDSATGRITGSLAKAGDYAVALHASNALGCADRKFLIRVGEAISLTPAMGWNSWNCWAASVDQEKVLRSARAMVKFGLDRHGWTYVNIDDTWQGIRAGPSRALQPNEKFPDIKGLCDEIHSLGLKAGIYSTPWVTSYANHAGGSSENPEGAWTKPTIPKKGNVNKGILPWAVGRYHFMIPDARQWAQWGFDYLKYDWSPIDAPDVREMAEALRASGRDIVYSLSNSAPISGAGDWAQLSNSWRTSGDIRDNWNRMWSEGYGEEPWLHNAGPGHWNDPDMLVVGWLGWGPKLHPSALTADEQYTHISLWCLLSAPLLIGCDMERLDPFTIGLLTNDEVLAVDQDAAGRQAHRAFEEGDAVVYAKQMQDGSWAVGLFNHGLSPLEVTADWAALGIAGPQKVRDLWRQRDIGTFPDRFVANVPPHGVVLVGVRPD